MDIIRYNPRLNLWFLVIFLLPDFNFSLSGDRITANQSLSGNQTIVSKGGVFKLGFFKPGNASEYSIGIWYNKLPQQTIVWNLMLPPVPDSFSSALVFCDGKLALFDGSQNLFWSTDPFHGGFFSKCHTSSNKSVEAVLLDDGNFIVNGSDSNVPLWQSFDYPFDTLLPGANLGWNNITKIRTGLQAWKSEQDPTPGLYTLDYYKDGDQQHFVRGGYSGGTDKFPVLDMSLKHIYNFSYVNNANGQYFAFSLYNVSVPSRLVITSTGQIQLLAWSELDKHWTLSWFQPPMECQVRAYCGLFSVCNSNVNRKTVCECLTGFEPKSVNDWNSEVYSGGCVRTKSLQCSRGDAFWETYYVTFPINGKIMSVWSEEECKTYCLNDCSCTAFGLHFNQCVIWFGDLLDINDFRIDDSSGILYVKVAKSEILTKDDTRLDLGIDVFVPLLVVTVFFVVCLVLKKNFRMKKSENGRETGVSLTAFRYRYLKTATKNFSEKLGSGGFGSVFKGTLTDLSVIAVKKLEIIGEGQKSFRAEISTLGTIQHVNLVRLRGFCCEEDRNLLVYDYVPNGSLDSHVFHGMVLDWKTRYNVALGIARGLAYLHEKCRDCIIHCDIKPENILLDSEFRPKLADFGLAKLMGRNFSRVLTTMKGTRGYFAPEWLSGVAITTKADVYSYGMVLFELVSGRRNSEKPEDRAMKYFPIWVGKQITEGGDMLRLLDPKLGGVADVDEVTRICKVACWCIQDDETQRPTMGQIVQILEGILNVDDQPPIPRSLEDIFDDQEYVFHFTEPSCSQSLGSQSQTQSDNSMPSLQANKSTASIDNQGITSQEIEIEIEIE